jgi:pimeloyl-ACP methyl ester carboxylesterase/uncharacterized protein (DUF952 family)
MTAFPPDVPIEHRQVPCTTLSDGTRITLHVALAGPPDGTPVILLHGFPELWRGWVHQIPALARAGYRVIAPDMRGYNLSSKPPARDAYHVDSLVHDIPALADALGLGPFHLVGHDWGGAVAWEVVASFPERIRTLTILNCPRVHVLLNMAKRSWAQIRRSWYILAFQPPVLGERLLLKIGPQRLFRGSSRRGTFDHEDIEAHGTAWKQPGAATAMLNYYRANLLRQPASRDRRIKPPTLVLWGLADQALGPELVPPTMAECDDGRLVELPGVSHWSPAEAAPQVNTELLAHLARHGGPDPYVYKLVERSVWDAAPDPWPGSTDDLRDGFVHLSSRAQVAATRAKWFAGATELLALAIDPHRLPPGALRWEANRRDERFPHLYAFLPRNAAVRIDDANDF